MVEIKNTSKKPIVVHERFPGPSVILDSNFFDQNGGEGRQGNQLAKQQLIANLLLRGFTVNIDTMSLTGRNPRTIGNDVRNLIRFELQSRQKEGINTHPQIRRLIHPMGDTIGFQIALPQAV